jgi:hypothetical protein
MSIAESSFWTDLADVLKYHVLNGKTMTAGFAATQSLLSRVGW